eukprot:4759196-Pleurochrysis_carterae.AAC.1
MSPTRSLQSVAQSLQMPLPCTCSYVPRPVFFPWAQAESTLVWFSTEKVVGCCRSSASYGISSSESAAPKMATS